MSHFSKAQIKNIIFPHPIRDQDKSQLVFKDILGRYIKDIHAFIFKTRQFNKIANIEEKLINCHIKPWNGKWEIESNCNYNYHSRDPMFPFHVLLGLLLYIHLYLAFMTWSMKGVSTNCLLEMFSWLHNLVINLWGTSLWRRQTLQYQYLEWTYAYL